MLRIGVDLDGVLVNWWGGFTKSLAPNHVHTGIQEEINRYGWRPPGVTDEAHAHFRAGEYLTEKWWLDLQPYSQHDLHLTKLLTERHNVYFITSRHAGTEKVTAEWLRHHLGKHEGQIILTDDKASIAKGLALHAMIEDFPQNLVEISIHSPQTCCVLLDRPWNRADENGAYATRVYSLKDAFDYAEFGICRTRTSSHRSLSLTD